MEIYPDIKIITGSIVKHKVSMIFHCHGLLHSSKFVLYIYTTAQYSSINQTLHSIICTYIDGYMCTL